MNNRLANLLITIYFLAFFIYYQYYFLLVFIIYLIYVLKKQTHLLISVFSVLIALYVVISLDNIKPPTFTNPYFKVINVNKNNYYIKNNEGSLVLYTKHKLNINDQIKVNLKIEDINSLSNFNVFDYKFYLKSKNIYHRVIDDDLTIIKSNPIDDNLISDYYQLFFSNNKSFIEPEINDIFKQLSIVHLIVISGFHFNIMFKIISNIFSFVRNDYLKNTLIFLILYIFLASLNFSVPATKAFMVLLLRKLFEEKFQLKSLDALSITGVILLILKPYYLIDISFLLTFFISYVINLLPKNIKEHKFKLNFVLYLFMIPLISNMNYEISIFSFLYTIILTPVIISLYVLVLIGYYFNVVFIEQIIILFQQFLVILNSFNIIINTGKFSIGLILFYYIILIKIINDYNKMFHLKITLFFSSVIIYSFIPSFEESVTFMNFKQNDCIVIKRSFKSDVMIIDVGQSNKEKNVENILVPYLKSMKIKYIGTLVFSHDDIDHSGGYDDLKESYKINEIISKKQKDIYYHDLHFIDPMYDVEYVDKNSNSISLYVRINGLNYYFASDITSDVEFDIVNNYEKFDVDILKVAHHGSKTSSSSEFLLKANPKIAFVSRGLNNRYKHPHYDVVKRLNSLEIVLYDSAIDGSLKIFSFLNSNCLLTSK